MPSEAFKVVVVGSHFVGKSTLCRNIVSYLKEKKRNVGFIDEVVRDCPFPINEMATLKAQDWILEEQKRREKEMETKHDFLVMDRGVIDNFAYWMRVAELNKLNQEKVREKTEEVFEHSKNYNVIFFLQPFDASKITNDKFRSVDPTWRNEMHERVTNIMNHFQMSHTGKIFMLDGNREQAIKIAKRQLDKHIII